MRKSRSSGGQIVRLLKKAEAGRPVANLCRENAISQTTFYKWKDKFGVMEDSNIRMFKELEAEHSRLKQMYAELSLENKSLERRERKRIVRPGDKR